MGLEIAISILIVAVTAILLLKKWSFSYWHKRNVYTHPPKFPYGNAEKCFKAGIHLGITYLNDYFEAKAKKIPFIGFYLMFKPIFIPVDINLVRNILITDFQYFTDHANVDNVINDPLSGNLFNLRGAKWKVLRAKLTPIFTSGKLKNMFETLVNCTLDFPLVLDEAIQKREPIDIEDTFARYTTDIIGSVGFGIDCNCLKNSNTEFREIGKKIVEVGVREHILQCIFLIYPKLLNLFGLKRTKSEVERFVLKIVRETIEYRDKHKIERKDYMQLLMKLRDQKLTLHSDSKINDCERQVAYYKDGLTLKEVAAQAYVFFLARFETSSTTLNFLMFELVQHPEIQHKLREEINLILEAHGNKITYEAVKEMIYLDQCVYETLRKYPTLPMIPRICTKDYQCPGSDLIIEKDTFIMIPAYGIHHDPEFYPDPEKFIPERFSEENKSKRPAVSFLGFGEGPRICIGLRMGLLQTKVGLIALLRNYKFSLNSKTKVPLKFDGRCFILTVEGGVWVDVSKL